MWPLCYAVSRFGAAIPSSAHPQKNGEPCLLNLRCKDLGNWAGGRGALGEF